nr:MAG TPA: hypothetical protein [Caudoviricetes sp.]
MKINDIVERRPQIIYDQENRRIRGAGPLKGKVVYIHPAGRWHMVEFSTPHGPVRECFYGV